MKVRRFQTDVAQLKEAGSRFVKQSSEAKMIYRATIVTMYLNGMSTKALSDATGESPATINLWVKIADEQGFEALLLSNPTGRPSVLNDEQMKTLSKAVADSPNSFGYDSWDGKSLCDFISKHFNITLSIRQCQRLLKDKLNPKTE